jgi:hypothetical protein
MKPITTLILLACLFAAAAGPFLSSKRDGIYGWGYPLGIVSAGLILTSSGIISHSSSGWLSNQLYTGMLIAIPVLAAGLASYRWRFFAGYIFGADAKFGIRPFWLWFRRFALEWACATTVVAATFLVGLAIKAKGFPGWPGPTTPATWAGLAGCAIFALLTMFLWRSTESV